jgi:uncharacterized membrane protein
MTTPIVMLVLMMGPYLLVRLLSLVTQRDYSARRAAAIGLTVLFVFTGLGHFIDTASMAQMLPPWIPERVLFIYLTGVLEFAVAAGFLSEKYRRFTGWVAAIMLVSFFPANVYAALNHIAMGGHAWAQFIFLFELRFRPSSYSGSIGSRSSHPTTVNEKRSLMSPEKEVA